MTERRLRKRSASSGRGGRIALVEHVRSLEPATGVIESIVEPIEDAPPGRPFAAATLSTTYRREDLEAQDLEKADARSHSRGSSRANRSPTTWPKRSDPRASADRA